MASPWTILSGSPLRSLLLLYLFLTQSLLLLLRRILLPSIPTYQPLRTQLQRAWFIAASRSLPGIINYLPATHSHNEARELVGAGWRAYLVPGSRRLEEFAGRGSTKSGSGDDAGGDDAKKVVVLYSHGGGYAMGEARMYVEYMNRWIAVAAARKIDLVFVSLEYPLSSEAPYPAQLEAHISAYRYLLGEGIPTSRIVFMGDSAGGDLSILSGIFCLHNSLPQPAATILISPWIDFSLSGYEGGNALSETDYVNATLAVPTFIGMLLRNSKYTGTSPEVNALCRRPEELAGLNPQLIFVGGGEFALADSTDWAKLLRKANVANELTVEYGLMHIYAMGSIWIPASIRAKTDRRITEWIERYVK